MSKQASAPPAGSAPPLSLFTKFAFGTGSSSESIFYIAFNLFCFFYYVQVLGLPAGMAGFAAGIALLFDAVSDPLAGYISDRWRWGRMGRRHPMMFLAALPLGLAWTGLFSPPEGMGHWGLFGWLLFFSVAARIAQTLFYVPHIAMGGELTNDYEQRTRVFSWHIIFLWVGGASVHFFGLRFFFASEKDAEGQVVQNGMLVAENYPIYGLAWAAVMMAVILFSTFFTMSRIPYLNTDESTVGEDEKPPTRLWDFFSGMGTSVWSALHNHNFRFLLLGLFIQAIGSGVFETLTSHAINYIWQLTTEQYSMVSVASLGGYGLGFIFVARMHVVLGKRLTLAGSMVFISAGNAVPMLLLYLGAPIAPGSDLAFAMVMGGAVSYYAGQSVMLASIVSILGDISDEHELNTGKRREGVLYSSRTLFSKVSSAMGHILAGILLSVIAFPLGNDVQPGEVSQDILREFMLMYVILIPIPPLVAGVIYLKQRLTQSRHQEILEQLRLRKQEHDQLRT